MAKYLQNMAQQAYRGGSAVTSPPDQQLAALNGVGQLLGNALLQIFYTITGYVAGLLITVMTVCYRLTFAVKPLVCKIYSRQTKISNLQ